MSRVFYICSKTWQGLLWEEWSTLRLESSGLVLSGDFSGTCDLCLAHVEFCEYRPQVGCDGLVSQVL